MMIIGGHSLGFAIAVIEATTYHDVDGMLITDMSHHLNGLGTVPIVATLARPRSIPRSSAGYSIPGYLTPRLAPGSATSLRWRAMTRPRRTSLWPPRRDAALQAEKPFYAPDNHRAVGLCAVTMVST